MTASYITPKLKEGETVDLSLYNPRERTNIRLYGLECKDWVPRDVAEYKQKWAPQSEAVTLRGKLDQAQRWLREHLYQQDYNIQRFANPDDSHTIHFKNGEDAMLFKMTFYG